MQITITLSEHEAHAARNALSDRKAVIRRKKSWRMSEKAISIAVLTRVERKIQAAMLEALDVDGTGQVPGV